MGIPIYCLCTDVLFYKGVAFPVLCGEVFIFLTLCVSAVTL